MDSWRKALLDIRQHGRLFVDDENRRCCELTNMVLVIDDLSDVKSPLQWIRSQTDWFYPSDEELETAVFGDSENRLLYGYGSRIFRFGKEHNQLDEFVIPLLKKHPHSRRALVVLADPLRDGVSRQEMVSLVSLWFHIVDEELCVSAVLRSNDFLLGWPANVYQVRLLQEYVGRALGVRLGAITTVSLSAHFFSDEDWLFDRLLKEKK